MSQAYISPVLRAQVATQSRNCCCYCLCQENVAGMRFTLDHIIPESLGGETVAENLCLACWDCNLLKHNRIVGIDPETDELVSLFHPWQQSWQEHFRWEMDGLFLVGLTPTGRATIHTLRLNRPLLLRGRERWIAVGWHPPEFE
jgi:5-methylcytosine-specific restriction endonuclease McrA